MIRLLQFLIFGHIHEWKEDGRDSVSRIEDGRVVDRTGIAVFCTCKKCGIPRRYNLY